MLIEALSEQRIKMFVFLCLEILESEIGSKENGQTDHHLKKYIRTWRVQSNRQRTLVILKFYL